MTYKLNKETCLWFYAIVMTIVALGYWNKAEDLWFENSDRNQKIWTLMVAIERLEAQVANRDRVLELNRKHYEEQLNKYN